MAYRNREKLRTYMRRYRAEYYKRPAVRAARSEWMRRNRILLRLADSLLWWRSHQQPVSEV